MGHIYMGFASATLNRLLVSANEGLGSLGQNIGQSMVNKVEKPQCVPPAFKSVGPEKKKRLRDVLGYISYLLCETCSFWSSHINMGEDL